MSGGGPVTAVLGFTYGKHQARKPLRLLVSLPFLFLSQLNASVSYRQRADGLASPLFPSHLLHPGFV